MVEYVLIVNLGLGYFKIGFNLLDGSICNVGIFVQDRNQVAITHYLRAFDFFDGGGVGVF
jgi:hypothetical protein